MKKVKRLLALVLSLSLLGGTPVYADSQRTITLGADLTEEQTETVLNFFGVEDVSSAAVITVCNEDERQYLEGIVSDDIIGTRTFSCAYIEPTQSGGINVKTANLTYVTESTLVNALMTAGVQNCNLIVTAPFKVSGTGALTGVFMAYENMGETLDDEKKELASEELILTAELEEQHGSEVADVITDIKNEVASSSEDMSEDEIKSLVENMTVNINLSGAEVDSLTSYLSKLSDIDYAKDAFDLEALNEKLDTASEEAKGFWAKLWDAICSFFSSIWDWITGLFGGTSDSDETTEEAEPTSEPSIFDEVNQDEITFDVPDEATGTSVSSEPLVTNGLDETTSNSEEGSTEELLVNNKAVSSEEPADATDKSVSMEEPASVEVTSSAMGLIK